MNGSRSAEVEPAPRSRIEAVSLDVCGVRAEISGDWPEVVDGLCSGFAWFAKPRPSASPAVEWLVGGGKSGTAAPGLACAGVALARARTWRLWPGRDPERNWAALRLLLG